MPDKTTPLEAIIAEIRQQADTEIESIMQATAREVAQIEQRGRSEAERLRNAILQKAQANAAQIRKRTAAQINLAIRQLELQSRLQLILAIQQQFEQRLLELRQRPEYVHLLEELIIEGIVALETEACIVSAGKLEQTILTAKLLHKIANLFNPPVSVALDGETLNEAGVIIYSADRRRRFDNRLRRYGARLFETYQWSIMQTFTDNKDME
jgi:vacuolar-type H+-ATPase subunit E/Vma4